MPEAIPKIIILEDEKSLARALELKFSHEGFEVKTFASGKDILSILEKEKISLIICDLIMPEVDGFQTLKLLKTKEIKVPVIILTNLTQSEDEKKARDLGAVDFLIKSDTPLNEVVARVKKRLAEIKS
jgi:DNA-binding response OmpR family regulator